MKPRLRTALKELTAIVCAVMLAMLPSQALASTSNEQTTVTVTTTASIDSAMVILAEPAPWYPYINTSTCTQVYDVDLTDGSSSFIIEENITDSYDAYLLQFKNGGKENHAANPGKFEQNWFEVVSNGSIIDNQYKLSSSRATDGFSISIDSIGNREFSKDEVVSSLYEMRSFALIADTFQIKGDMEGNVACNELTGSGELGITSSVVRGVTSISIDTYVDVMVEDVDVELTLMNKQGSEVDSTIVVTDSFGTASHTFTIDGSFSSEDVYCVVADVEDAEYVSSDIAVKEDAMMATENVNFAKHVSASMLNGKDASNDFLVSCDSTYPGRSLTLQTVSESEFDSMIDVDSILSRTAALSMNLADAKTSNDYIVLNINAEDLEGARINIPNDSNKDIIINVISDANEIRVNPDTIIVGDTNLCDGQTWDERASNIIWNYVHSDGTPFDGTVRTYRTIKGTVLCPMGTYNPDSSSPCLVIADTVIQGNGEFHKVPLAKDFNKQYALSIYGGEVEIEDEEPPLSETPEDPDPTPDPEPEPTPDPDDGEEEPPEPPTTEDPKDPEPNEPTGEEPNEPTPEPPTPDEPVDEEPNEPNDPDDPEPEPDEPVKPYEPSNEEPNDPYEPEEEEPEPEDPTEPSEPDNGEEPDDEDPEPTPDPEDDGEEDHIEVVSEEKPIEKTSKTALPQTGDETPFIAFSIIALLSACGMWQTKKHMMAA